MGEHSTQGETMWEHDEFYDGYFDLWCDMVEERQEEEFKLTESEYIEV